MSERPERILAAIGAPDDSTWTTLANIGDYVRARGFTKGGVDDRVGALASAYDGLWKDLATARAENAELRRDAERQRAQALRHAASRVRNATHTCMSEQHCGFLHAAHERVARELEKEADAAIDAALGAAHE